MHTLITSLPYARHRHTRQDKIEKGAPRLIVRGHLPVQGPREAETDRKALQGVDGNPQKFGRKPSNHSVPYGSGSHLFSSRNKSAHGLQRVFTPCKRTCRFPRPIVPGRSAPHPRIDSVFNGCGPSVRLHPLGTDIAHFNRSEMVRFLENASPRLEATADKGERTHKGFHVELVPDRGILSEFPAMVRHRPPGSIVGRLNPDSPHGGGSDRDGSAYRLRGA